MVVRCRRRIRINRRQRRGWWWAWGVGAGLRRRRRSFMSRWSSSSRSNSTITSSRSSVETWKNLELKFEAHVAVSMSPANEVPAAFRAQRDHRRLSVAVRIQWMWYATHFEIRFPHFQHIVDRRVCEHCLYLLFTQPTNQPIIMFLLFQAHQLQLLLHSHPKKNYNCYSITYIHICIHT